MEILGIKDRPCTKTSFKLQEQDDLPEKRFLARSKVYHPPENSPQQSYAVYIAPSPRRRYRFCGLCGSRVKGCVPRALQRAGPNLSAGAATAADEVRGWRPKQRWRLLLEVRLEEDDASPSAPGNLAAQCKADSVAFAHSRGSVPRFV